VRKNTVIYNSKDIKHRNIIYKDEIWKIIAEKVGKSNKSLCRNYYNIFKRCYMLYTGMRTGRAPVIFQGPKRPMP